MQSTTVQADGQIKYLNRDFAAKSRRKYALPLKLTLSLIGIALVISSICIICFLYYPFITFAAIFVGVVLFFIFIKPRKFFFITEEYAPDYTINESSRRLK